MKKYNDKINKFGRKLFLTGSLLAATTIGNPVMGQNSQSNDSIKTEYVNHEDSLYTVLLNRYGENNKETAAKLSKKSTDAYLRLLDEGKVAEADSFMVILHENFEKKEVAAARKKAYTINGTDSEKLKVLKKNTRAIYKNYVEEQKRFAALDKQLVEMRKTDEEEFNRKVAQRDSAARAEGVDPKTLPEMKFEPSEVRLNLELRHANSMDELVRIQVDLAKNDMILHQQQLKEDLILKKQEQKRIEANIKLWDQLQVKIDDLQKQINKFSLVNYNPAELNGKNDHDKGVAETSQTTARENLAKYQKLQNLKKMKEGLLKQQKALGTKAELTKKLNETKQKIAEIKAELKQIRRGKQVEIKEFKVDAYAGSDQQKAAEGVKTDRGIAPKDNTEGNASPRRKAAPANTSATAGQNRNGTAANSQTATTPARPSTPTKTATPAKPSNAQIIQNIRETVAEKKEEFASVAMGDPEVTTYDNHVVQTLYKIVGDEDAIILEYPNGKAAIIEGDTTTVYNIDGHKSEYIKSGKEIIETRDGERVENSTVKTSVDILQVLNATGGMRR